jgi:hypothetical protein
MYEDRQTLPELRWFRSITVYVDPKRGINTSGRARAWMRLKRNSYQTGRGAAPTRLSRGGALPSSAMSLRPRALPAGFIAPCLPTSAPRPPSGALWLHEIKHDGFRVIGRKTTVQKLGTSIRPDRGCSGLTMLDVVQCRDVPMRPYRAEIAFE